MDSVDLGQVLGKLEGKIDTNAAIQDGKINLLIEAIGRIEKAQEKHANSNNPIRKIKEHAMAVCVSVVASTYLMAYAISKSDSKHIAVSDILLSMAKSILKHLGA